MKHRSLYLTVRVDIECPDDYDGADIEIADDIHLNGVELDLKHECKVVDYEICGLND